MLSKNWRLLLTIFAAIVMLAAYLYFIPDCKEGERLARGALWFICVK